MKLSALSLTSISLGLLGLCFEAIAAPPTSSPCSLLTQAEVEQALGNGASMTPTHNPRTGKDVCVLKPGTVKGIVEIQVLVLPVADWETTKKTVLEAAGKDGKHVVGLGEDAFVTPFVGYNVRKGSRYVQVFGDLQNDSPTNERVTRFLAERAVSRM